MKETMSKKFWYWAKPWVEAFPRGWWSSAVVKFTYLNICDRSVPWMKLPTPCYPGISWYLFGNLGNQTQGMCFFCHFRKTKVFWHDAFGCFTVNYCTNYFAVLVGIICFLPKISPVQWQMTLVFRLGGAQKNSAMNWGNWKLWLKTTCFFRSPGVAAHFAEDFGWRLASAVSFIHSF